MRRWVKALAVAVVAAMCGAAAGAQGGDQTGGSQPRPYMRAAQSGDAAIQKKVDAVFAEYDKADSPGCSLGVIREGQLIYTRGYGSANLEHGLPITSRTVFDIGSTSKQFSAASILLLEQQGKLSRDDDVRKWVPELPDYGQKITIRHLLHHTSGLRDYLTLMSLSGIHFDSVTTPDDALGFIVRQKELNFPPGEEHLYSNSGYFLLSTIVQRASGKSLRAFAHEHIFAPLGMSDTHYHDDHTELVPRRAAAYAPKPGGGFAIDMSNFEQTGDGAVFTTVEDLLKWDQNFYDPKVGGQALIEGLQQKGKLNSGQELDYATGVVVSKHRGLRTVSHGGSWGGYRAELVRFPEQKFSVIAQCNLASSNPSRLARQVAEVYLEAQMTPAPPATAAAAGAPSKTASSAPLRESELARYTGVFRSPASGALRRIRVEKARLRIDSFGPGSTELMPMGEGLFAVAGTAFTTEIKFDATGGFTVQRATDPPETERFERAEAFEPSAAELAAFAGTYYSEELDVTYVLSEKDGKLWTRIRYNPPGELRPAVRDLFVGPQGIRLEFARDAQGRPSSFVVQAGRVRNIRFVRR
jgi:CubicO group peptidase (beta-lactamase class C family)